MSPDDGTLRRLLRDGDLRAYYLAFAALAYFFDRFDEEEAGRAWSVEGMLATVAGVLAPAAGGALYTASPRLPFLVGGVLMVGATLVAVTLPD